MADSGSPSRKRFRADRGLELDQCPRTVNVTEFVEARALEITQLLAVVDNVALPTGEVAQGPRTFVQRLPRHLRRRAMSYNIKRLPRRLRNMAESQIKESKHRKKPPSRRWRRRPRNLLNAYVRRQRRIQWLETHIWHAKRFHMIDLHNWRVPDRSCQRGFRANYRDAVRHCVVQDISYYVCLELRGPESVLIDRLNTLCQPSVSQTFSNSKVIAGTFEGRAILYEPGSYPSKCIGCVQFMYRPKLDADQWILWIWIHPSIEPKLTEILVQIFGLRRSHSEDQETSAEKFKTINDFHSSRTLKPPTYQSDIGDPIEMRVLKHELLRFRLIGPKSGSVLDQVLHRPSDFTHSDISEEICNQQWDAWKRIYGRVDVGRVDPGLIISISALDPRLFTDYKKRIPDESSERTLITLPKPDSNLNVSPIWDSEIRRRVLGTKLSDAALNDTRRKDTSDSKSTNRNVVPILLIQQSSPKSRDHIGFGSGWDIILPAGWAMPFWIAMQYATARAVGLDFQRHFAIETAGQTLAFPQLWPDTESGVKFQESESDILRKKYLRRPINRRVDYELLRITHPFNCPWIDLVNGWLRIASPADSGIEGGFYVLRDRIVLRKLDNIFSGKTNKKISQGSMANLCIQHPRSLVTVQLRSIGKGLPKARALICMPTKADLVKLLTAKTLNESEFIVQRKPAPKAEPIAKPAITELEFIDLNIGSEKEFELDLNAMFEDKKESRLLDRKRKDKERKKKKHRDTGIKSDIDQVKTAKFENIVDSCQRRILGYVVDGDFSLSNGRGQAVGFCSLLALKHYRDCIDDKLIILYRNVNSKYYRAAKLSIFN